MIKKLVSKALLSVVMDKKARSKLDTIREKDAAPESEPVTEPKDGELDDLLPRMMTPKPPSEPLDDEVEALVRQSLEEADRTLERRRSMSPERKKLIQEAMAIQRSKTEVLDQLSDEQKEKLQVVAMKTLFPDGKPGGD